MSARQGERLNRYLARRGFASRRAADALIGAGRVTVNGRRGEIGAVVDPATDSVTVDGRAVSTPTSTVTIVLNKPAGVVTTRRDPHRRTTVMDLVPASPGLVPVGRLDADSRGLLLLTTDGELAHRVAHPRYEIRKRYQVRLASPVSDAELAALGRGVELDDGFARPLAVERARSRTVLSVVMGEGRRREVRRLCAAVGLDVVDLLRLAVGPVELGKLPEGECRPLTDGEDHALRSAVGLLAGAGYDASRVVTIDGPAGSGKSTLGRRLAEALHLPFLDTGLFYRAVAVAADAEGAGPDDAEAVGGLAARLSIRVDTAPHHGLAPVVVDGEPISGDRLHDPRLAAMLSAVSALPAVRRTLLQPQRSLAAAGAVAVGRDCGTVVFPDARVKLYLQAGEDVRVRRRARQLSQRSGVAEVADLATEVSARDWADSSRAAAPLRPAPDALVIDTESNGIEAMVQLALQHCAAAGLAPQ